MASSMCEMFSELQKFLEDEQEFKEEIRVVVRELEQRGRELLTLTQKIHQPEGLNQVEDLCQLAHQKFEEVQIQYGKLSEKLPVDQYYRFNDFWRFITQRLCFLAALIHFLHYETLITKEECAETLGVQTERTKGFHLEIEDYLMGVLQLASELSRLAINSVTSGDYNRPIRISRFLGDLDLGFRLLNLKNDSLRKRFDGLKYDLRKVEEVVYDVTIRGLQASAPSLTESRADQPVND